MICDIIRMEMLKSVFDEGRNGIRKFSFKRSMISELITWKGKDCQDFWDVN